MKIDAEEVLRIARAVAARYARRCWWADIEDLTQEASLAVLEVAESGTWDPQVGVPFDGYASRAAARRLHDALWRESSPVSGGLHDPKRLLDGLHRGELANDYRSDVPRQTAHVPQVSEDPGAGMDDERWRLAVRRRIRQIARRTKGGDLAVEVLVRGRSSGEVITDTGGNAYGAVHLVRRKARGDAILHKLLRRRPK